MKLLKKYKITFIIALLAIIFVMSVSFGTYSAFAARTVTIDGSNFFYTNGEASVRAHEEGTDEFYTMFHFAADEDNVTYRYNLAYQWYQASESDATVGEKGWFNLTVGFESDDFERYVIKLQSQQYSETEDGVTTNYIVFFSEGTGNVYCYTTDDEACVELSSSKEIIQADENGEIDCGIFPVINTDDGLVNRITITFTGYSEGEYSVTIADENNNSCFGALKNVGGTYSKRVNSTTAGVMPLTFTAYLGDDNTACDMVLYELNNQSFLLSEATLVESGSDDGNNTSYYVGTDVVDDVAPVLCLEGNLRYLEYGEALDFDYVVIDVLASSPQSTIHYYVLSADIYNAAVDSKSVSYFLDDTTDDNTGESLFDKTSDDDDAIIVESTNPFLTDTILTNNKDIDRTYTVGCLVMAYVELDDVTSTTGNHATTNVYLNWYIEDAYLANVEVNGETCGFIMALTDEQGATYATGDELTKLTEEYQAKIDELAYDENGNIALTAGSTSEIYLPSYEGFITDNLDGYEDLTYSIYYTIDGSQNSSTSLSYNTLSITLSSAGSYKFTIYAKDSASNNMYYINEDGELVEFSTSEVYDEELQDILPWFTFEVVYTGATVEAPGEQTTGYVDTEYSVSSFDINGVSSYYETSYALYRFDRTSFNEYLESIGGATLSYSDFVENVQALFENTYIDGVNTRQYFTTIKELSSLNETDEDYDDYVDYAWDSSGLTFVPQDENAYYLVRLTVTDTYNHQSAVYGYMGIHVSAAADSYSGESDWLENNLTSVILFAIAGVALIAIIILFIIKPKEEGDLDEQLASEAEGIKAKKAKKANKKKNK